MIFYFVSSIFLCTLILNLFSFLFSIKPFLNAKRDLLLCRSPLHSNTWMKSNPQSFTMISNQVSYMFVCFKYMVKNEFWLQSGNKKISKRYETTRIEFVLLLNTFWPLTVYEFWSKNHNVSVSKLFSLFWKLNKSKSMYFFEV